MIFGTTFQTNPTMSKESGTWKESNWLLAFQQIQEHAHSINVANGFWDDRRKIVSSGLKGAKVHVCLSALALVTSEVAEAMEAVRKHPEATWADHKTKDTMVRELAGTVVRLMDLANELELPLAKAVLTEIEQNAKRGHMHGGKAA